MQTTAEDIKSKRQQFSNQIRRQNRQQIMSKRRNINANIQETTQKSTNSSEHIIDARFAEKIKQFHDLPASKQSFMAYLTSIHDPDILKQHFGIIGVRKLLSQKKSPPIQQVIDAGLIPKLIKYAENTQYPQLQLQAVWCLTNVVAGNTDQTRHITDKGGIKIFVNLLLSNHIGIIEQAIWALGNIACDSPGLRDLIINSGGLKNLIKVIELAVGQLQNSPSLRQIIQSATWSISGICRTQPLPNYLKIKQALPVFFYVIQNNMIKDLSILGNLCWAISYYTNKIKQGPTKIDKIQICIQSGVVPYIVQYLSHSYDNLVVPCLKIIGNIANGNEDQSSYLFSLNIIEKIEELLKKPKKVFRRESCWALSNLAAGTTQQIHLIFSNEKLIMKLLQLLKTDLTEIKIEICYIFSNALEEGDQAFMFQFLVKIQFVKTLVEIIESNPDKDLLLAVLQCLENVLFFGKKLCTEKKKNHFSRQLYQFKAIPKLEQLQYHEDEQVYQEISKILSNYFELEDPLSLN